MSARCILVYALAPEGTRRGRRYDLVHFSFAQGASTITEQLGKLLYLHGNDHPPWRKLEDAMLAVKLENRYGKETILTAYLNTAYFGDGAHGVWAASERYFGRPPGRLDVGQASLLAGLIQAPSVYDPLQHPLLARERQIDVLRLLVRGGFLTQGEAAGAVARPLLLRKGPPLAPVRGLDFAPGPAFVWWRSLSARPSCCSGPLPCSYRAYPGSGRSAAWCRSGSPRSSSSSSEPLPLPVHSGPPSSVCALMCLSSRSATSSSMAAKGRR